MPDYFKNDAQEQYPAGFNISKTVTDLGKVARPDLVFNLIIGQLYITLK